MNNNIFESYKETITEEQITYVFDNYRTMNESIILLSIAAGLAAGTIFRIIDGIRGNKPKLTQYIKGLLRWAFSEYKDGSLSINAIRQAAYDVMREDKEIEDQFGPSSSTILSKMVLNGLKKGSKEFAKILGTAIGRIAKRANMSENNLDKIMKAST